jgi:prevent-host-death family protein
LFVDEIAISKFKATCLAVLERVRKTGKPILVTRFGRPLARIEPPAGEPMRKIRFGTGAASMTINGDIVAPISDISEWEAARDSDKEQ